MKLSTVELSASASSSSLSSRDVRIEVAAQEVEKWLVHDGVEVVHAECWAARGEAGRCAMGTWKSAAVKLVLDLSLRSLLAARAVAGRADDAGERAGERAVFGDRRDEREEAGRGGSGTGLGLGKNKIGGAE